jgi:hypothetical protein
MRYGKTISPLAITARNRGDDGKTFHLPWNSGLDNLDPNLTINGTTKTPTFLYDARDATASTWPARYGTDLVLAETGDAPETDMGCPTLVGGDTSVRFTANNKIFRCAPGYEFGTDDIVYEIVFYVPHSAITWYASSNVSSTPDLDRVLIYNNSGYMYFALSEASTTVASRFTVAPTGGWYHAMYFADRSGYGYVFRNGESDDAADNLSGVSGALRQAAEFSIGGVSGGGANNGFGIQIAYFAAWQGANWLDTHLQTDTVKQRFYALTGIKASQAKGDAYPTSYTRNSIAVLDKIESDGRRHGYIVGPNWPRICSRLDSNSNQIQGYLSEGQTTNVQYYSENISSWASDATVSVSEAYVPCPTGGRVWKYTEDSSTGVHRLYTTGVPTASQKMLMSVFAKVINGRHMMLYPSSMSNNDDYVTYDLVDGEIQTTGGTTDTLSSYGIEDWGDGWYRCWVCWDWGADTGGVMVIASANDAGSSISYEGNNRDNFYVCGPQFENVNAAPEFPSSYIPHSTTSATRVKDVLKYDGNLNAFGIRESLLKYAEDFDNWTKTEITSVTDGQADPFGGTGADLVLTTGVNTPHHLAQVVTTTEAVITMGAYMKMGVGAGGVYFYPWTTVTNTWAYFSLVTGQFTGGGAGVLSGSCIDVGDGWYRCSITVNTTTVGSLNARIGSDSENESFYVYGATIYEGTVDYGYNPNRVGSIDFTFLGDKSDYSSTAVQVEVGSSSSDDIAVYSTGAMRQLSNMSGGNTGAISTSVQGYDDGEIRTIKTGIGGGSSYLDVDGEKVTDSTADLSNDLDTIHIGQNNSSAYQPYYIIGPVKLYSKKRG